MEIVDQVLECLPEFRVGGMGYLGSALFLASLVFAFGGRAMWHAFRDQL